MKKMITLAAFAIVAMVATACCGGWPQKSCCESNCCDSNSSSYPKHG